MAKFNFENSRYAKFFGSKDNVNYLKKLIDTQGIIGTNYGWYLTQGKKAASPTAVNNDGTAVFQIACRSLEAAPLMDMRAPLADALQRETKGSEFYAATIPHFIGKGTVENAMERDYKVKLFECFGDDEDLVMRYVDILQNKIDSVDATLNWMTAKLMSTGKIDYRGIAQGIQAPIHNALVPIGNFAKAGVESGSKIWTDPDCNILAQMRQIEAKYRDQWGATGAFVWQMTKKMYNDVFLKNSSVQDFIKSYRTMNYLAVAENLPSTDSMFRQAAADLASYGISPIQIVEEKERNITATADTMIQGWADNVVVFRPAGDATEIQWAEPSDQRMFQNYGAKTISKVFAKANGGLSTIINTTQDNGQYKEWHTDIIMSAVPALTEFLYHVVVDTTQAVS